MKRVRERAQEIEEKGVCVCGGGGVVLHILPPAEMKLLVCPSCALGDSGSQVQFGLKKARGF